MLFYCLIYFEKPLLNLGAPRILHEFQSVTEVDLSNMPPFPEARFLKSANQPDQFPLDEGAEVAFAGRSNAGKSSAINAIVNRRGFARTSKSPGRTQLVNFFLMSEQMRLVDLPGYGFARVARSLQEHWQDLLQDYFEQRKSLTGLILVVDSRRLLKEFDWQMLQFCRAIRCPVHVLLTKSDKLKKVPAAKALTGVRRELGDEATVQLFSAVKRQGLDQARQRLNDFLDGSPTTEKKASGAVYRGAPEAK
jgi:GTP-binding protein